MLGLTRYEIPLDSRLAKWFNNFSLPIRLSAGALYPCVLDGAVFVSFDGKASSDAWDALNQIVW